MKYKQGYYYQLAEPDNIALKPRELVYLGIERTTTIIADWIKIERGVMSVRAGYAWNGLSGTIDTHKAMRSSLYHDAGYQLIREGHLQAMPAREGFDLIMLRLMTEDGMSKLWRTIYYMVVCRFASFAATSPNIKPTLIAP